MLRSVRGRAGSGLYMTCFATADPGSGFELVMRLTGEECTGVPSWIDKFTAQSVLL